MKGYKLLFLLGLIVLIFPFLGVPETFRIIIITASGFVLLVYSLYLRSVYKSEQGSQDLIESSHENTVSEKLEITENQFPIEAREEELSANVLKDSEENSFTEKDIDHKEKSVIEEKDE